MPKTHTFPTLYNEVLQLKIADLKRWKYLTAGQIISGLVTWSRNGNKTGEISIQVNMQGAQPFVELDYSFKGEARKYSVLLTSSTSNLKAGEIWYFVCPKTNKRCRKLYSIGGYFLHREAFKGCMYETQTRTKKVRAIDKRLGFYFKFDELYRQLNQKHLKRSYAGKPTKKYLRLTQKIQQVESVQYYEIERALLM